MKLIDTPPPLAEQVHRAILAEIAEGRLLPGARIIQEQIAQALGVSRQPVQQALLLLRDQGVLREAPGRGLQVAPLDLDLVRQMYELRAVIEGLAFRRAAQESADVAARRGPALIQAGRKAVASGSVSAMITADMAFHAFIYELSGNPLVAPAMDRHWTHIQRVMGGVLVRDDQPRNIWDQHEALLDAVAQGRARQAESLARRHIQEAADFMIARLAGSAAEGRDRSPEPAPSTPAPPAPQPRPARARSRG
jgi:DNA-binding GntR family transcriptional regulator